MVGILGRHHLGHGVDFYERRATFGEALQTNNFGLAHIPQSGYCVSVERRRRHLVKVHDPYGSNTGPHQHDDAVASDAAGAKYTHSGVPDFCVSLTPEERLMPRKHLVDDRSR